MSNIIALDCDGVLLNWHGGFITWVEKTYGWLLDPDHPQDTYDMQDWFSPVGGKKMTKDDFVTLVKEFNSFPRCLDPLKGVKKALVDFRTLGYKPVVVTSFGSCPRNCEFREEYLRVVFEGLIEDVIILGLGECKEETLIHLKPDAFVEDNRDHAIKAQKLGIDTYLINYPFNQGADKVTYVSSLDAVPMRLGKDVNFNEYEEEAFNTLKETTNV